MILHRYGRERASRSVSWQSDSLRILTRTLKFYQISGTKHFRKPLSRYYVLELLCRNLLVTQSRNNQQIRASVSHTFMNSVRLRATNPCAGSQGLYFQELIRNHLYSHSKWLKLSLAQLIIAEMNNARARVSMQIKSVENLRCQTNGSHTLGHEKRRVRIQFSRNSNNLQCQQSFVIVT